MQQYTYIYALVDPRTDEIRYVGKSDKPKARLSSHLYRATKAKSNKRLCWLKGLLNSGYRPRLLILEKVAQDHWPQSEKTWIRLLKAFGIRLTNDSGGGKSGGPLSAETREKLRQANLGKKHTPESKRKLSEALKRHHRTPEHIANNLASRRKGKGWPKASEETKRKMSTSQRKRHREHPMGSGMKIKMSRAFAKLTDDEVREIRRLLAQGRKQRELAQLFNSNQKTIWQIGKGERYAHVK